MCTQTRDYTLYFVNKSKQMHEKDQQTAISVRTRDLSDKTFLLLSQNLFRFFKYFGLRIIAT